MTQLYTDIKQKAKSAQTRKYLKYLQKAAEEIKNENPETIKEYQKTLKVISSRMKSL